MIFSSWSYLIKFTGKSIASYIDSVMIVVKNFWDGTKNSQWSFLITTMAISLKLLKFVKK